MSSKLYIHLRDMRGGAEMPVECVQITDEGIIVTFTEPVEVECCDCNDDMAPMDTFAVVPKDSCGDPQCPVCNEKKGNK